MLDAMARRTLRASPALLTALVCGVALSATPRPPVVVLGGQRALLETADGDDLACVPTLDAARRTQVTCALVEQRSGLLVRILPGTYSVQLVGSSLAVSQAQDGATPPQPAGSYAEPPPARARFGAFRTAKSGAPSDPQLSGRYGFAGTSLGCTTTHSGLALTCFLVDAAFKPLRRSYGFTVGFKTLQVIHVDAAGAPTIVAAHSHYT